MPTAREGVRARLARRAAARRTPTLTRKLASAHALACEHGCRQRHSMGCVAGPNLGSPAASCVAALRFGAMLSAESSSVLDFVFLVTAGAGRRGLDQESGDADMLFKIIPAQALGTFVAAWAPRSTTTLWWLFVCWRPPHFLRPGSVILQAWIPIVERRQLARRLGCCAPRSWAMRSRVQLLCPPAHAPAGLCAVLTLFFSRRHGPRVLQQHGCREQCVRRRGLQGLVSVL